ncbi:MAG: shikimate kinase [Flavobacterium sp.]
MTNKLVLVGYMGAGKSTVAKILAKSLQLEWLDLDDLIVLKEKSTITDIFKTKGEIYFRRLEHQIFSDLIASQNQSFVLSTGGGTPCYANNHLLLNATDVTSVYLKASLEHLVKRIIPSKAKRPLMVHLKDDEIADFVAKHLFERSFFYHQAKFVVSTDEKSPTGVARQIMDLL